MDSHTSTGGRVYGSLMALNHIFAGRYFTGAPIAKIASDYGVHPKFVHHAIDVYLREKKQQGV